MTRLTDVVSRERFPAPRPAVGNNGPGALHILSQFDLQGASQPQTRKNAIDIPDGINIRGWVG